MSYWSYWLVTILMASLLFFGSKGAVFAQEYVLPYPGFMPGHPLYKITEAVDKLQEWWSFGSFAKFSYHLGMADKKLIEAKTLFEYKQYKLAKEALAQFEHHVRLANTYLSKAHVEGKNISQKKAQFKKAIIAHEEVLLKLKKEMPKSFLWVPEEGSAENIQIEELLNHAIGLIKEYEER